MLLICCFSMSILLGCTTKELIPDKYRENPDYYYSVGTGINQAEAFDNALMKINLMISSLILSKIASISELQINELQYTNNYDFRSKYIRKIASFTKATLLALKPAYKSFRKKKNGIVECGLVIYFPFSRIMEEAESLKVQQKMLKSEIEKIIELSSHLEGPLSIENLIKPLLDAYALSQNLIFNDLYSQQIKNKIYSVFDNIIYGIKLNPDTTITFTVTFRENTSLHPITNEEFAVQFFCDNNTIIKYARTNSQGIFNIYVGDLKNCGDSLIICPSLIVSYIKTDRIFNDLLNREGIKKKFFWNKWKTGKLKLTSVSLNGVEWFKKYYLFFWRYYPANITFQFNINETGGLDIQLRNLKIKIVGDMENGETPEVELVAPLRKNIHVKKMSESSFFWVASPEFLKIIRYFYLNGFINIIINFQVTGIDSNGNLIESATKTITLTKQIFRPPSIWNR